MATIHSLYKKNCHRRARDLGYVVELRLNGESYFNSETGSQLQWHDFLSDDERETLEALEVPSDSLPKTVATARRKAWAAFTPAKPSWVVLQQEWCRVTLKATGLTLPQALSRTYSYMGLGLQVAMDNTPNDDGLPSNWWMPSEVTGGYGFCEVVPVTTDVLSEYYALSVEVIDRLFDMQEEPGMTRAKLDEAMQDAPFYFLPKDTGWGLGPLAG